MYTQNKQINHNISLWLIMMFFIVSFMIIVGGLTRLTDSGLSITQWQLFSGFLPPLNKSDWNDYFNLYKEIPEFYLQNYSMSMEEFKVIFWWEWAHRFLGRLIGILYLFPLIYFSFKIKFKELVPLYIIFFLICFQGFIGWYMVSSGLVDRVDVSHFRLAIHLVIAFIILSLIFFYYLKFKDLDKPIKHLNIFLPIFFIFLIYLQIIFGAFVSGMDAGKIYNSWPLMGTTFFPDDSQFSEIFSISSLSDRSIVQFIHRNLAYIILFYYLYLTAKIYYLKLKDFFYIINLVGILLFIQIILGIATLLSGATIMISSLHQISSIFLVTVSVYFLYLNLRTNQQPLN